MQDQGSKTPQEYEEIIREKDALIHEKDALIDELRTEVRRMIDEREDMIDSFKISTNVLIERLKDLESQKTGYRPQTANVLPKAKNEVKISGAGGARRITGKAIKNNIALQAEWEQEIPEDPSEGGPGEERKSVERKRCQNCSRMVSEEDFDTHTITCYRNVTRCKVCGDYIASNAKISHLSEWRNPNKALSLIDSENYSKLKLCFQHGADINWQNPEDNNSSYLHLAVKKGSDELFTVLMGFGINPDITDENGNTPLMLAAQGDSLEIMKSITEVGGSVNAKNKNGWTALFFACKKGDKQMVEYLIEHSAKVTETTPLGDNCLKIAQKNNHQDIAILLVSKGASLRSSTGFKVLSKQHLSDN